MEKSGPQLHALNHLMPHRIREVLLVSSFYDAFILEEDGYLGERIFAEYKDLNLTSSPRVTHVSTGEMAIQYLEKRRFDLVITMTRLADMDVESFGRRVKELRPGRPVVQPPKSEYSSESLMRTGSTPTSRWNGRLGYVSFAAANGVTADSPPKSSEMPM